jgi:hypothetical protein
VKRQEIDLQAVRDCIGKGESVRQIASVLGISPALLSLRLSGKNRWNKPQQ